MKHSMLTIILAISVAGTMACSSVKVKSDWDKTIDFSRYSTWSLSKGSVPPSTVVKAVVNEAVEEVMAAKGYTTDTANPDLIIIPYGGFDQALRTEHFEWGYGAQPGGGSMWGWGGSGFTMRQITTASVLVDVVDPKTDILVWRGLAEGDVEETAEATKRIKRTKDAIHSMMSTFPAR